MTKIVLMSDTHMAHENMVVPNGDILIHCGDATFQGEIPEVASFGTWFSKLPHKYKIFVAGNHDWLFEKQPSIAKGMFSKDVIYLEDSLIVINGLKIWGSPVQPWFCDWAFNKARGNQIKKHWDLIPNDIDVLVTHGPPYGILDACPDGNVGCEELLKVVNRIKPKIHAFGHIHEGHGVVERNGTTFVNASIMDEMYNPVFEPRVIEL